MVPTPQKAAATKEKEMSDEAKAGESQQAADDQTSSSTLAEMTAKMERLQAGEGSEEQIEEQTEEQTEESTEEESTEEQTEESTDDEKGTEGIKDDDLPMLPSGHRRAALARGYTTEEVDQYLRTKPEEATVRFGEIFDDWQKQNSQWSDRGRQLADIEREASKKGTSSETATKVVPEATLAHFDVEALVEEHGDSEELIKALVAPMNAMVDRVNAATEKLSKSEDFLRTQEINALTDATRDFFKSKEMESSKEVYGDKVGELTDEQMTSRMKLFEQADMLVTGAAAHGKDITIQDALERAHILTSQGTRDDAIRAELRKSLKKRTKTERSSHQKIPTGDQPVTEDELERRVAANMQKIKTK